MSRVTEEQMAASDSCDHDWQVKGMRRECNKCHVGELIMDMDTAKNKDKTVRWDGGVSELSTKVLAKLGLLTNEPTPWDEGHVAAEDGAKHWQNPYSGPDEKILSFHYWYAGWCAGRKAGDK